MLRGVIFDFNGTLARLSHWRSHRDVFTAHGLGALARGWGEAWDHALDDGARHEDASRTAAGFRDWELARLRARVVRHGVPESRAGALADDLDEATKTMTMTAYADAGPALAALHGLGIRTAVCSNWHWDLDGALRDSGLGGWFAVAVTSARAGMRKPDPRIYRMTLAACGLTPEETLFVGDMWGPDVAGPRAVGMRAAYLCRTGPFPDHPVDGVWCVRDLAEVVPLARGLTC